MGKASQSPVPASPQTEPERSVSSLWHNESGAIMLMGIFMATVLVGSLYYVVGIGDAVSHRETMQDGSDAAALSAAITMARGMNFIVLINLLMAALVLVILILKLIVTLLGIAALVLAAFFMYPMAATVAGWAYDVNEIANDVQDIIFQVLEVCHYVEYLVKVVTPAAAELATVADSVQHAQPPVVAAVVLPERWTLPVEPGDYSELCGKAGEMLGGIVAGLLPLPNVAKKGIRSATKSLASALSGWFCGSGGYGAPMDPSMTPTVDYEVERPRPTTTNTVPCEEALVKGEVEFVSSTPGEKFDIHSEREYKVTDPEQPCALAEKERHALLPSDDAGGCSGECVPELFVANYKQARFDCNPKDPDNGALNDYMYSTATIVDVYKWDKTTKVFSLVDADVKSVQVHGRRDENPANPEEYEHRALGNPCRGYWQNNSFDEDTWNLIEKAPNPNAGGDEIRRPVCGEIPTGLPTVEELDAMRPPPDPEKTYPTRPYSAVLDVYLCSQHLDLTRPIDMGAVTQDAFGESMPSSEGEDDTGDKKSPYFVEAGLNQGDEAFQVRSLSFGKGAAGSGVDNVIRIGAWGKEIEWDEPGLDFVETFNLANFSVSQAEFFFEPPLNGNLAQQRAERRGNSDVVARATDNDSWNWEMGWRARLVPFTLPSSSDDDGEGNGSASASNGGAGRTNTGSPNDLNSSVNDLSTGITNGINGGVDDLSNGFNNGVDDLSNGLNDGVDTLSSDINAGINNGVNNGINTINNGVNNGINTINNGVNNGINTINNGVNQVNNGINTINNGVNQVNNGINTINNGINTINNGVDTVNSLANSASPFGDNAGLLSSGAFAPGDLTSYAKSFLPPELQLPPDPSTLCNFISYADEDIANTCQQVLTVSERLEGLINH